jgi:hypothetical protein
VFLTCRGREFLIRDTFDLILTNITGIYRGHQFLFREDVFLDEFSAVGRGRELLLEQFFSIEGKLSYME